MSFGLFLEHHYDLLQNEKIRHFNDTLYNNIVPLRDSSHSKDKYKQRSDYLLYYKIHDVSIINTKKYTMKNWKKTVGVR